MSTDSFIQQIKNQIDLHLEVMPSSAVSVEEAFVVSLYGEWGIGKTYTLKSLQAMYEKALRDAFQNKLTPQSITIPVLFSPWRFEKEEHLIVPLVKTVQAQIERLTQDKLLRDSAQKSWLDRFANAATSVANLGLSLAAGFKFKVSLLGLIEGEVDLDKALKHDTEKQKNAKHVADTAQAKRLPPEAESLYYDTLAWLAKLCDGDKANAQQPALRFVLFIDDLDRCLPDKAVEMLESIKLFLDIPSFAFVIGVDNEVIERGIRHRYDQYLKIDSHNLPITGNEYLEKIVHLPLMLPRMREDQARILLEPYRTRLARCLPLQEIKEGVQAVRDDERIAVVFKLLIAIVPLVPRKLIRAMEGLLFKLSLLKAEHPAHEKLSETFVLRLLVLQQLYPSIYRLIKVEPRNWLRLLTVRSERGVFSIEDEGANGKRVTLTHLQTAINQLEQTEIAHLANDVINEAASYSELCTLLEAVEDAQAQRGANRPLDIWKVHPSDLSINDVKDPWREREIYMHHGVIAREVTAGDVIDRRAQLNTRKHLIEKSLKETEQSAKRLAMVDIDFSGLNNAEFSELLTLPYFDPSQPEYKLTLDYEEWWDQIEAKAVNAGSYQRDIWNRVKSDNARLHQLVSPRYQLEDDPDPAKALEVRDLKTGLIWRRAIEKNTKTDHLINFFTFDEAIACAVAQATADKHWRVPKQQEFASLIEKASANNDERLATIDRQAFPDAQKGRFWSSSSFALVGVSLDAIAFDFQYGQAISGIDKTSYQKVRLVRSNR